MPLHRHGGYWELVLVTHGSARHLLDNETFMVGPGDAFVIPADTAHGYDECEELGLTNIIFDPRRLQLPENQLLQAPGYSALFQAEPKLRARHEFQSRLQVDPGTLTEILTSIRRMRREIWQKQPGFAAAATAHLCHVMIELTRNYGAMGAPLPQSLVRLSGVMQWLDRNFDRSITVDSLAEIAHMSRSSFLRSFRSAFGSSPMNYVTKLRVEKAAHLLRDSGARVKEVAQLVGIEDRSYFARVFRRHMGVEPSAYWSQYQRADASQAEMRLQSA